MVNYPTKLVNRVRTNIIKELLTEITRKMIWLLVMLFGYLGYFAEIRQYFEVNYGFYITGILDGVVLTTTLFTFFIYIVSNFILKASQSRTTEENL